MKRSEELLALAIDGALRLGRPEIAARMERLKGFNRSEVIDFWSYWSPIKAKVIHEEMGTRYGYGDAYLGLEDIISAAIVLAANEMFDRTPLASVLKYQNEVAAKGQAKIEKWFKSN